MSAGLTNWESWLPKPGPNRLERCIPMESGSFDTLAKQLSSGTNRRRALAGLGALALGGVSVLGLTQNAAADEKSRCVERCVDRGGNNDKKQRRERCRRKCQNR